MAEGLNTSVFCCKCFGAIINDFSRYVRSSKLNEKKFLANFLKIDHCGRVGGGSLAKPFNDNSFERGREKERVEMWVKKLFYIFQKNEFVGGWLGSDAIRYCIIEHFYS